MGKIFKKGLGILGIVLLVAIVCLLVIELWYLPHYWINQKEVATNNNQGDEITLMSCNVRCFAPDDLFKKSWFYRADLIASNISQVQPDIEYSLGNGRIKLWERLLPVAKEYFWLGAGIDNLRLVYPQNYLLIFDKAHNLSLMLLSLYNIF